MTSHFDPLTSTQSQALHFVYVLYSPSLTLWYISLNFKHVGRGPTRWLNLLPPPRVHMSRVIYNYLKGPVDTHTCLSINTAQDQRHTQETGDDARWSVKFSAPQDGEEQRKVTGIVRHLVVVVVVVVPAHRPTHGIEDNRSAGKYVTARAQRQLPFVTGIVKVASR